MVVLEMEREEWKEERKEEGASQLQSQAMTPGSSRRWRGADVKVREGGGGGAGGREGGKESSTIRSFS